MVKADALVLSGGAPRVSGGDVLLLGNLGSYLDELDIPILAICVSHQFMGMHFGGKAGPADTPEFGKTEIEVIDHGVILKGLPERFIAWESHNDEVKVPPKGFKVLARSEACAVQVMEHETRPLFGIQFHPEVEHTQHGYDIFKNFIEVCRARV
jgi:GMP synthase (glutamine-hydrolysing)